MKKYINHVVSIAAIISFLVMAFASEQPGFYYKPKADQWTQECEFFTPFTVQYKISFFAQENNGTEYFPAIHNGSIKCKVIRHQRIPQADSCYWNMSIQYLLLGLTTNGILDKEFSFTYGSVGDYFTLEASCEKEGYNQDLQTSDHRRFHFFGQYWASNDTTHFLPKDRILSLAFQLTPKNDNP